MRLSFATLLVLIALILVVVVEGRTVLAFFGIGVSPLEAAIAGVVAIGALLLWAVRPPGDRSSESDRSGDDE
ncbi:hypothetical protein HTG_01830 [Natrinema mahii]|nr:hypothetical protein HTG_01830 [Natrinema mahii]